MKTSQTKSKYTVWGPAALCIALSVLGILCFADVGAKWMTLLAGAGIIFLLATRDLKPICNAPSLLLLGYVLFSWLTIIWAMSGKFHLREWSKMLIALFIFLLVVLREKPDRGFARRVMGGISGMSAIYALMSVEAAATGLLTDLLKRLPNMAVLQTEFNSSRLYGIFGNSNIEASIYAIGILLSIALLCGSETKQQKILFAITLSFNAFAFLLVFSMGAIVCFAAAVIVYLIAAGKGRGAALLRMLEVALPTVVFVFLATRFFNREGAQVLAVVLMLLNAAVSVFLELRVTERLNGVLEHHGKAVFGLIAAVVLLAVLYAVAGSQITSAYTFGDEFDRSLLLDAGEHTLNVETDGDVNVMIYSQNRLQIIRNGGTTLYNDVPASGVAFAVPEDAEIVFFRFSGEGGAVIHTAVVDGQKELPLHYKLLPGFVANRIQNLTVSNSQIQRRMYREDGMKLFRLHPVGGNGVGAFETGLTAVQNYPYQTKYIHNHYIQILLEDGVIGFVFFAGALIAMAIALWKKRKQTEESEFFWIYPALCAEFVMSSAQMLWDVSMSMVIFICMVYAVYALIVSICTEPLAKIETVAEETPKKGKKKAAQKKSPSLARVAGLSVTAMIVLTLCGNLYAGNLINRDVSSYEVLCGNMEKAAKLDLYEKNDAKLSYVVAAAQTDSDRYIPQANAYAKQLAAEHSNSIPRYLIRYYLQTKQYAEAIDEAMLGATYSATDADTWNQSAALLRQGFLDSGMSSPLLTDGETLLPKLMAYYDALQAHNASALMPVELDEEAQAFFDKVLALSDCLGDAERFAATLLS